jgi:hypothetical protein
MTEILAGKIDWHFSSSSFLLLYYLSLLVLARALVDESGTIRSRVGTHKMAAVNNTLHVIPPRNNGQYTYSHYRMQPKKITRNVKPA